MFNHTGVRNLHSTLACDKRISKMLEAGHLVGFVLLKRDIREPRLTASPHVPKERLFDDPDCGYP